MKQNIRQTIFLAFFTKISFGLFLISELFFPYTIINQFSILFLCGMVILQCLTFQKFHFHIYFIFALLLIIQSYWFSFNGISIDPQTSLAMSNTLIINFFVSIAVYNYILLNDNLEKSLFLFARIGIVFVIIITIISLDSLFSGRLGSDINFSLLGREVSYNSNSIALIAGFTFFIYLYKYNKSKNIFYLFIFLILSLVIILSGSRKGVSLLIFGIPLLIFLLDRKKRMRNVFIGILLIGLLYWLVTYIPVLYNIMGYRIEALLNNFLGVEVQEASTNTRASYIERGWEYFLKRPWTGYGLDNFRNLPFSFGTYSHNNYIELLISGGIFSFIFYYIIRVSTLIKLYIYRNVDKINQLLFVILLLLLIVEYGLVDYFTRIYIVLFIFTISVKNK